MASSEGAEVPVRSLLHIRPLLPNEEQQGCRNIVQVGNQDETVTVHGRPYAFDCVVGEGGGHPRSYMCEQYILPLCRSVCSGINCAVLAYGQTSSGKTYTMGIGKEQLALLTGSPSRGLPTEGSGDSEGSLGAPGGSPLSAAPLSASPAAAGPAGDLVIPYALRQLFRLAASVRGRTFSFTVSFVEVYMEKYYDLLAQRAPVAAKTSRDGEVILVGAQLRHVTTMEEVVRLLQIGGHARITKGTNQNDRSSRSHAVLTIHVHSRACAAAGDADDDPDEATSRPAAAASGCDGGDDGGGDGGTDVDDLAAALSAAPPLSAKLHLVDLAGSESVGRAGTVGLAAKEGNTINLSLMTLRNLIQMLASPQPARPSASGGGPAAPAPRGVLPYRDSKLTTLLRDALGGNSSTLFVACVSPADVNSHMTVSTLEFATTARRIRTKVAVNIGGGDSGEVLELHKIITRLRAEIEHLKRQAGSGPRAAAGSPGPASSALSPRLLLPIPQLGSFSQPGGSPLRPGASPPSALLSAYHQAASCTHTPSGSNANVTLACGAMSDLPVRSASVSCVECAVGAMTPQSVNSGPRFAGRSAGNEQCDGVADGGTPFRTGQRVHDANGSGSDGEAMEGVKEHRGSDGDVEEGGDSGGEERGRRRTPRRPKERSPRLVLLTPEVMASRRRSGPAGVRRSRSCTGARVLGLLGSPGPSRPASGGGAGSGSSNGGLSTFSSYDRSLASSCGRDAWSGGRSKALQQRVELLEAENETLQKQVVHLSAVIGDLRAQLDEAHAAALAAAAPPSPHTPTAVRGRRAYQTEGGADAAGATPIAIGAAARSQRSPLSRCSPADSPLGAGATTATASPGEGGSADRAESDGGSVGGLRQRSDSVTGGPAGLGHSDGETDMEQEEPAGRREGMEVEEGGEVVLDWGAGEQEARARGGLAAAAEALPAPPLETLEERPRSLLTWIRDHVAATEAQLHEQQEALRGLLAAQGLGPAAGQAQSTAAQHGQGQQQRQQVSLPSRTTLLSYTAQQLAGVEAELAALGAAEAGEDDTAGRAETPGRVAELQARRQRLFDMRAAVEQMSQLQDALELQREVELLVNAYAGLYGSEQSTVTAPSMARAAAAVEEQRLALRRARRQQVLKDSAVAKEKLREIEALSGPPTPQQFGVVLACPLPSGSSSSINSTGSGPPMPFHTHQQHVDMRRGAAACGPDGVVYADWEAAGAEDETQQHQQLATSASTPPLQPTTSTTSLFSAFLPALTPTSSWRRTTSSRDINPQASGGQAGSGSGSGPLASMGSGGPAASGAPAALSRTCTMPRPPAPTGPAAKRARVQLHLHQVSPWLDALLDWEVRGQYYGRALAGVTQEREAVYAQLQDVDRQLKELQDAAAQAGMVAVGSDGDAAASPGSAAAGCSASYASWAPPHVAAVLAAGEGAVQQHVRLLQAQQEKLMARLEDLCVEVAATQLALVEVQEGGCSAASERDEWWGCVGSLELARPVLRGLVERAAGYRSAFQDALQRAGQLEFQVSELELQCQEGEARLAAQCLELTATKAAALAAVAAPGLPNTRAAIAGLLPHAGGLQRSGAGGTAGGAAGSGPVSPAAIGSSSWAAAKAIDLAAPRWQVAAAGLDCPTPSAAAGAAPPTLPEVTQVAA